MADLKISALTGASTPLAGTEVLPIVQSSTTKKVSVADLTAGRAVAMQSATITGAGTTSGTFTIQAQNSTPTSTFSVRDDGYFQTGTAANSPYNVTIGSLANVFVLSDGALYRSTASSQRFKENITDWTDSGLSLINSLKPRTFTYKASYYRQPERMFLGLIAEEVNSESSYLVDFENEDGTGQVENVRYATIVVPLIKAVQELSATITSMQTVLDSQQAMIEALQTK